MRSADKTKTRKKASEPPRETEDDVTRGLGGVRIGDENSDLEDPLNPDTKEDEDSEDEEELPLSGPGRVLKVPRKQTSGKVPACPTPEEDRTVCTQWYVTFLGVKEATAEYLHDLEDLVRPSDWVKLTDKTISVIMKGCRDQSIHVSATAIGKMGLLAFLCMHHERIQRPILDMTSRKPLSLSQRYHTDSTGC
jgi:hypothetical protein